MESLFSLLFIIILFGQRHSCDDRSEHDCTEDQHDRAPLPNVNFITFAAYHVGADATIGNIFVLMSIAIAAAEVAVGIALILNAYKIRGSSSTDDLTTMRW